MTSTAGVYYLGSWQLMGRLARPIVSADSDGVTVPTVVVSFRPHPRVTMLPLA